MKNWSLEQRIIVGFSAVGLTIVALGIFAFTRFSAIGNSARLIATDSVPGLAISSQIEVLAYHKEALLENHILAEDTANRLRIESEIHTDTEQIDALLKQFGDAPSTDVERRLFATIMTARGAYLTQVDEILAKSAVADGAAAQIELEKTLEPAFKAYAKTLQRIREHNLEEANDAAHGIQKSIASAEEATGFEGFVCIFLALVSGILLTRAVLSVESANRAKSAFLATMSHEIRTPMNAILGYTQLMLRDATLGADAKANLKIVNRSGEHLLSLINDVLDISKIEAGRMELMSVTFNVSRLVDDLAAMFRLRAESKALAFELTVNPGRQEYVVGDQGKIRQVLINLIGNAIKFTERGRITLDVSMDQKKDGQVWMCARVGDTGMGLSADEQKKLFQPFAQMQAGLNIHGGTGLGLAISRKYARLMGGDITVTSKVGTGCVFQFEIPMAPGDARVVIREQAPRRVVRLRPGQETARVLVVDDQLDNRDWLKRLLTGIGFEVKDAENGEVAIRLWADWAPQLILMDVHMPVLDGCEATKRIRSMPNGKKTAIIGLTASALDHEKKLVGESGANVFVTKPCHENELLERIRELLGIAYEYDDNVAEMQSAETPLSVLRSERLGKLPNELTAGLRAAVSSGNKSTLNQLIQKVGESGDEQSAKALQELADNYEYDALTRVLEEVPQL